MALIAGGAIALLLSLLGYFIIMVAVLFTGSIIVFLVWALPLLIWKMIHDKD